MHRVSALAVVVSVLAVSLFVLPPTAARAYQPVVTKLHGRATTPQVSNEFGTSVAVTERWLLVGEPFHDDVANNAGAAHLYDARTGRYLRKLTAPDGQAFDRFGLSVALSGNLALVGAQFGDGVVVDSGAAYVFNVLTGALVSKLIAPDGVVTDIFGGSVALSGTLALVGANQESNEYGVFAGSAYVFNALTGALVRKLIAPDGTASDRFGESVALSGSRALVGASDADGGGSAYVLDAVTGDLLAKLTALDRAASDNFGWSVALSGNRALVGAFADDDLGSQSGSAYVFDARTGVQLRKLTAPDGAAGGRFGSSVSLSGNRALVGAATGNGVVAGSGAAYVLDVETGALMVKLMATDGAAGEQFGASVALSGNRALVGANLNDDVGNRAGAVYLYREVAAPLPLTSLSQARNFAPGVVEADFRSFGEATINADGEVAFPATMAGPGAGRRLAAAGLWSDVAGSLRLIARGGTDLGTGLLAGALGRPVFNRVDTFVNTGTLAGAGVTRANDLAILRSTAGGVPTVVLREGGTDALLAGGQWGSFPEVVQSHSGSDGDLAAMFQLQPGPGGVGRANDSGVVAANHDGTVLEVFREGAELASNPGVFWGQMLPRVSKSNERMSWIAALTGAGVTAANNQALYRIRPDSVGDEVLVARRGDAAAGGNGALYGTITGAAEDFSGSSIFRATLMGSGVTRANNEGLWRNTGTLVVRKGDEPDPVNEPGVVYSRFLKFWTAGTAQVVFQAALAGPGVNRRNDVALYLWHNGIVQRLLREGDAAQTEDGALISTINRVEVEPVNGEYAVLATLTGNRAANLALYTGGTEYGNVTDKKLARVPGLALRKGTAFGHGPGETVRLLSLLIGNTTDAAGVGAKGGPQAIEDDGNLVMTVLLSNRAVELMKGRP
jgi:hypothetical protein